MSKNAELNGTLKRLLWVALLFISAGFVISTVTQKGSALVQEVKIDVAPLPDGHSLVAPEDIRLAIERSFGFQLEALPISSVDVDRLERVLEAEPFILDADVYVDARDKVNIVVSQRLPVLRIIDHNGLNYYLDESGVKMPLSAHFSARVLVATGNIPPHETDFRKKRNNVLNQVFELANTIRADEFLFAMIQQIYVNNRSEITLVPMVGNQKISFGRYQNVEEKLENLKIFYQEGLPYQGWQKYRQINLMFDGQVVCK